MTFDEHFQSVDKSIRYYSRYVAQRSGIDEEDAYQELSLTCWRAFKKFREDGGASLRTYTFRCLHNGTRHLLGRYFQHLNGIRMYSLESLETEPVVEEDRLLLSVEERCFGVEVLDRIEFVLSFGKSPRVVEVLRLLRKGYAQAQVAEEIGVSSSCVNRILHHHIGNAAREVVNA